MEFHQNLTKLVKKLICGEIYRAFNCTTNDEGHNEALSNFETILTKNMYPKQIIKDKIQEIRARNFGSSENKAKRTSELNDPNLTHKTISLPYTSFRCSVIA